MCRRKSGLDKNKWSSQRSGLLRILSQKPNFFFRNNISKCNYCNFLCHTCGQLACNVWHSFSGSTLTLLPYIKSFSLLRPLLLTVKYFYSTRIPFIYKLYINFSIPRPYQTPILFNVKNSWIAKFVILCPEHSFV